MAEITESRLAMYEGMIALAWADHELHSEEKKGLHHLIDSNPRFTAEQRKTLHDDVDDKVQLKDVWSRITEKQDKAHLLDIASVIFLKDGKYCENEKELYESFLASHMSTLDSESVLQEIRALAVQCKAKREQQEEELKIYASNFSLVGRLERFFRNIFD